MGNTITYKRRDQNFDDDVRMCRTFNAFFSLAIFVACVFVWYRMDYWLQE